MICFVAVVYNNVEDTIKFCRSLKHLTGAIEFKCYLVDNSDDPDMALLLMDVPAEYRFVEILRPGANLGYFGGFNYFLRNIDSSSFDNLVLCNNDLEFSPDFADKLSRSVYSDDVMVVCPDVFTLDGCHQNPHLLFPMKRLHKWRLDLYFSCYSAAKFLMFIKKTFYSARRDIAVFDRVIPIHMGIGACYVLRRSFLDKFNCLDYPHFLYGEEAYLSNQVHQCGGVLIYDPFLVVRHKESATLSRIPGSTSYSFARDGYWSYRHLL